MVELLMKQGIIPRPMTPDEYKRFVASESEKFSKGNLWRPKSSRKRKPV